MNTINDDQCQNKQLIALAQSAEVGSILVYLEGQYQWVLRGDYEGWYLTITENGYELTHHDGRSHGTINLGEPYFGVDKHAACYDCDKVYDSYTPVTCIPYVEDPNEDYGFGRCQDSWRLEWCPLCTCYGITLVDGDEEELDTQSSETHIIYNFDLRAMCPCDGKNIVSITKTEVPL